MDVSSWDGWPGQNNLQNFIFSHSNSKELLLVSRAMYFLASSNDLIRETIKITTLKQLAVVYIPRNTDYQSQTHRACLEGKKKTQIMQCKWARQPSLFLGKIIVDVFPGLQVLLGLRWMCSGRKNHWKKCNANEQNNLLYF